MFIKDKTAIVGVGSTPYYKRGMSFPQTKIELACKAILAACEDAGLSVKDIDGFAYYSGGFDSALIAQTLGIPEVRFTATLTGGGGGAAGSVGLAAAAITSGHAGVVVSLMTLQQPPTARLGAAFATKGTGGYSRPSNPETDFVAPHGTVRPRADVLHAGHAAHAPVRHAPRGVRRDRHQ
jgi:acetyl-CoA acetyltransferase